MLRKFRFIYNFQLLIPIAATLLLAACSGDDGNSAAPARQASSAPTASDNENAIDLIVAGKYVVTMDAAGTVIVDGAVAVDDGVILAVGPATDIDAQYVAKERLDSESRVVMPGLINGHSHAAMTLLRGVADDLALMDWLNNYIFPAEVEFVDAEFVRIGTELACWEMIRGGTTTFVDMYYYSDTIAEVVERCGMRALISTTVIGQRSPDAEGAGDGIEKGLAFINRWKDRNSRITPIFGPHANYTLNAEQLQATRAAANQAGVGISIHLSESPYELQYSKDNYGGTSIAFFDSIGFFDGPTIGAHVVWPTADEIPILAERQVGVIHNPTSNMKIASGIAPVTEMLNAGVRVGLGTDGAASNNDLDMWEEMRLASFLQKVDRMDPEALSAETVLTMATRGGAEAIGLAGRTGELRPGLRADLIQVSFDDVHFVPTFDVISHLVFVADEQDVVATVVDGAILMRDGQFLTLDTARIKREATALAARIQQALSERNSGD
ncbi:amidohydrolase family protein [Woeseia oceani]|uniref:amidohydrolase family protein n=1 Tax=Woeseia oceani TaxID=1548547 RepID=UPI0009F1D944|nr:amidohydrolase [Woeseia oceani]